MVLDAERTKILCQYFEDKPVLKAYVFGSYARAEADELSDIDLLLDLDYSQRTGLIFVTMKQELETLLKSKVDLVSSNGLSKYVQKQVDKEKQLIYAR